MITLNPCLATLAAFYPRELFPFAVQLLNLPTKAAHLLRGLRRVLSGSVGHDPVRAVSRHLNPEQAHLVLFRKSPALNPFAMGQFVHTPGQRVYPAVRSLAARVIHLAVVLQ